MTRFVLKRRALLRMPRWFSSGAALALVLAASLALAHDPVRGTAAEQRAARRLDEIRRQPLLLRPFLHAFPKGGDLHVHLGGAVYAETLIDWAAADGLCIDTVALALVAPKRDDPNAPPSCVRPDTQVLASQALANPTLRRQLIDSLSVRNYKPATQVGHYRFFDAFDRTGPGSPQRRGDTLAEVAQRAARQNELYLEIMLTPDQGTSGRIADTVAWNDDLATTRDALVAANLPAEVVRAARNTIDTTEQAMRQRLRCGTADADAGCGVVVRYLYQVPRAQPKARVFAHLCGAFATVRQDRRFVGLNLVQPEDWLVAMRDYDLHMRMLDFLHGTDRDVAISLHAGELAFGLVPPTELGQHVPKAVRVGHARRIGHGVDVMYGTQPLEFLREMAAKRVAVEINLTSNDVILGVSGDRHPLPMYLKFGVAVVLSTDDEGVSRIDLTHEYQRAVETYRLAYADIKRISRNSLEYAFLPGTSLWDGAVGQRLARPCRPATPGATSPPAACAQFLETSEKAALQWKLERAFAGFEAAQ